jgi:hypothetical protein
LQADPPKTKEVAGLHPFPLYRSTRARTRTRVGDQRETPATPATCNPTGHIMRRTGWGAPTSLPLVPCAWKPLARTLSDGSGKDKDPAPGDGGGRVTCAHSLRHTHVHRQPQHAQREPSAPRHLACPPRAQFQAVPRRPVQCKARPTKVGATPARHWKSTQFAAILQRPGGVAERLNAPVLKTGWPARVTGVRIPPPPLGQAGRRPGRQSFSPRTAKESAHWIC